MTTQHRQRDFPLRDGARSCTPEQLLDLWKMTRIDVRAALPTVPFDFDGGPSLPGRIRGALGHALRAMPGHGKPNLALQAFFGPLPLWRPRAQVPRPFAIATERRRAEIVATLTLFGRMEIERERLLEALLLAFELGLSVDARSGARRVPLRVVQASWTVTQSVRPFSPNGDAILLFRTPFRIGAKDRLSSAWDNLVVGLVERVAGMALWQGFEIEPDLGELRRIAHRLHYDDHDLRPETWDRRSGRENGKQQVMSGYQGRLIIQRPPAVLLPYLALGETTFVGAHAALGLGRYDLLSTAW